MTSSSFDPISPHFRMTLGEVIKMRDPSSIDASTENRTKCTPLFFFLGGHFGMDPNYQLRPLIQKILIKVLLMGNLLSTSSTDNKWRSRKGYDRVFHAAAQHDSAVDGTVSNCIVIKPRHDSLQIIIAS